MRPWTRVARILAEVDPGLATQAGVFGIVLVVAYYLLKRADDRESVLAATARQDLDAERSAHATTRADRDRLVVEVASLRAHVVALGGTP